MLARAKVALRESEIDILNLRLRLCETQQKQLGKQIEVVAKDVEFSAPDRDKQLQRLAETEADLKRQRRVAEAGLQQADAQKKADLQKIADDNISPSDSPTRPPTPGGSRPRRTRPRLYCSTSASIAWARSSPVLEAPL